jgi:carbonic anhydrase
MDSRTSAELIFDLGLGDIMSIRLAGNIATRSVIGSLEYACKYAGSKLVLIMGHTGCGAIKGVCDGVEDGNIVFLLKKIKPALAQEIETPIEVRNSQNSEFVNRVSTLNVLHTLTYVRNKSEILSSMEKKGEIIFVGAMYDVTSGIVTFYEN